MTQIRPRNEIIGQPTNTFFPRLIQIESARHRGPQKSGTVCQISKKCALHSGQLVLHARQFQLRSNPIIDAA